nr:50S ribosomal protein L11 methyltransferase [Bacteroides sp.]
MNDYIEARFDCEPCSEVITDVMAACLADAGYESFVPDATGLTAYIRQELFDSEALKGLVESFPLSTSISVSTQTIEGRDWNSEWERNYFQPIVAADGRCVIHSSFHTDYPEAEYDITIDPKMAFGTGHHATTSLIIERLLGMELEGKNVMDMGTGTAILAILAAMRGAKVKGVEIDEFAYANALDNVALNGHPEIELALGDASALQGVSGINLFLANINRNVITADLPAYVATMADGAEAVFSGFYTDDIPVVKAAAEACGLRMVDFTERDRWASILFKKA